MLREPNIYIRMAMSDGVKRERENMAEDRPVSGLASLVINYLY